jgi:hypothetical protein
MIHCQLDVLVLPLPGDIKAHDYQTNVMPERPEGQLQ